MRLINRTSVTIAGAKPFVDWTRSCDADFNRGSLTVRTVPYGTAYLLPELDQEEDVQEWVEEHFLLLFEWQLASWTSNEALWPVVRDLNTFRTWFRIEIQSTVVDVADDEIEGEEL